MRISSQKWPPGKTDIMSFKEDEMKCLKTEKGSEESEVSQKSSSQPFSKNRWSVVLNSAQGSSKRGLW